MNIKKYEPNKLLAIELLASNPSMHQRAVATKLGVNERTVRLWLTDPDFIDEIYKRYMVVSGIELPAVIKAMIEEAKLGNVQAGRLILEHFGKLEHRIKVQVESPFEKFVKAKEVQAEEAEYVEEDEEVNSNTEGENADFLNKLYIENESTISSLPKRDVESQTARKNREKEQIKYQTQKEVKKARYSSNSQTRYQIRKRAKAVGLEMMTTSGRPLKSEREEWLRELERLEIAKFGEIQDKN